LILGTRISQIYKQPKELSAKMSMTGVQMDNAAYADYTVLSTKKAAKVDGKEDPSKKYTWLTFSISADGKAIVTAQSGTGANYSNADKKAEVDGFPAVFAEFAKALTALKEPRFGVIDMHIGHKDGRLESKLVHFRWSPDSSKVGDKMKYAGSEGGFKGKVQAAKMLQCNDVSDVTLDVFTKFAFA
jgi:hypothetical protein